MKDIFGGLNIAVKRMQSLMESFANSTTTKPFSGPSIPLAKFPHCDSNILHAPKECIYCDMYPVQQRERIDLGINFTGEGDVTKTPCPAEALRDPNIINRWGGNKPHNLYQKALEVLTETEDLNQDTSYLRFGEDYFYG